MNAATPGLIVYSGYVGDDTAPMWEVLHDHDRQRWERGAQRLAAHLRDATADTEAPRFAVVEQMGHRSTTAAVREVTFCGQPMLELTDLKTGSVHLAAPQSLYEVTWLTEDQARARAKPWTATAITAGTEEDEDESARELAEEGHATAMSAAEIDEYERDGEAWLDAQDEADEDGE